jgi:L-fuconolactonase
VNKPPLAYNRSAVADFRAFDSPRLGDAAVNVIRRSFLVQSASLAGAWALSLPRGRADQPNLPMIIDTHQHLWDLAKFKLPWLDGAPEVLRHSYRTQEYLEATRGLDIQAVYMEVDVDPAQHELEVEHVTELARSREHPTIAAVVGGRPASTEFARYIAKLKTRPEVKGVRQVLHTDSTPPGYCLQKEFIRGVQQLGENGLSFDLCMRPGELLEGVRLSRECPETRFIVDHCGNADPKAFAKNTTEPAHDPAAWRKAMDELAAAPNTICKISGIVARAPEGWTSEDLAPVVNHCLDSFGPDRVVFGSDWPVCLLGARLRQWVDALYEIVANRPKEDQQKLWRANAVREYSLRV